MEAREEFEEFTRKLKASKEYMPRIYRIFAIIFFKQIIKGFLNLNQKIR